MRFAHNPKTWGHLSSRIKRNYPGGRGSYNKDYPVAVSYRTVEPASRKAGRKATSRNRSRAAKRRSTARAKFRKVSRRRNPGYPGAHLSRVARIRKRRRIATASNPALVAGIEKKFSKLPLVGKWAGSAAGASVFAFGGAMASVYGVKYFLAMESITESEYKMVQWVNTRPHWAYAIGGSLLGLLARAVTPGNATTKRAAQIAVTSAGFGAATYIYSADAEELTALIDKKAVAAAEAEAE